MIDFNKNAWHSGKVLKEDEEKASRIEALILADLASDKNQKYMLGLHLIELFQSRAYVVISDGYGHATYFWQFCESRFQLDKSTVSRYMNVVDEFGNGAEGLHPKWQAFSWSVLVEMIPMSEIGRNLIKPSMTCAQVREIKRSFLASTSRDKPPDKVENASDEERDGIAAMKKRYKGLSTDELMLELYRLHEEIRRLREHIDGVDGSDKAEESDQEDLDLPMI